MMKPLQFAAGRRRCGRRIAEREGGRAQVTGTVESHIAAAKAAAGTQIHRAARARLRGGVTWPLRRRGVAAAGEDGRPVRHRRRSGTPSQRRCSTTCTSSA